MIITHFTNSMVNINDFSDIDECKRKINPCGNNSDCTNNIGSYSCRCHDGFKDNHYGLCQGQL